MLRIPNVRSKVLLVAGATLIVGPGCSPNIQAQPPGFGPGGPGGPNQQDQELVEKFDTDDNDWLNDAERAEAREFLAANPTQRGFGGPGGPRDGGEGRGRGEGRGPGEGRDRDGGRGGDFGPPPGFGPGPGFGPPDGGGPPRGDEGVRGRGQRGGGPPGMNRDRPEPTPGQTITKESVTPLQGDLYDPQIVRTVFLDFSNDDWEKEMETFHSTDVEVPATITIDGQSYPNCGISFRGASSYGMVPSGYKRSLNISVDMANEDQRIGGYKTLNLLNGASDDSMMSTVLYSHIANQHIPAPRANFVRVVINGEDWGVYTNVEQFNKDFVKRNFGSSKGARWKVSGSPRGGGGLEYHGENLEDYRHPFEQKSGNDKDLQRLVDLCRVLEETPSDELPAALEPIVDVDNLLWFLALDNTLINSDGLLDPSQRLQHCAGQRRRVPLRSSRHERSLPCSGWTWRSWRPRWARRTRRSWTRRARWLWWPRRIWRPR